MGFASHSCTKQVSKQTVMEFITYLVMKGTEPRITEVCGLWHVCTSHNEIQTLSLPPHIPWRAEYLITSQRHRTHDRGGVLPAGGQHRTHGTTPPNPAPVHTESGPDEGGRRKGVCYCSHQEPVMYILPQTISENSHCKICPHI